MKLGGSEYCGGVDVLWDVLGVMGGVGGVGEAYSAGPASSAIFRTMVGILRAAGVAVADGDNWMTRWFAGGCATVGLFESATVIRW